MNRLRVLVVDDEPLARTGLAALVRKDPELECVGECGDGQAAIAAIEALAPDLVLLDVQMPEIDGFGVIRAVGAERMPAVIFVTAYAEFALDAFRVHALDYLVKPYTDDALAAALGRAKRGQLQRVLATVLPRQDYLTRITVRTAQRMQVVRVADIDWIEAADYCAKLHAGNAVHVVRVSLGALERLLDPATFVRVHRSAIINLDRLKEIVTDSSGDGIIALADGTKVRLARSRRTAVDRLLGKAF
ncbi:MAG TPA: LytTR family DNA-binding domain-containing protein [Gemmatimonadales bacterium]|jgi:two-component system LytT family response regulator|nr:LytTR family DNA-binding domain-containing protein [Gemmatimonadales bacterium]